MIMGSRSFSEMHTMWQTAKNNWPRGDWLIERYSHRSKKWNRPPGLNTRESEHQYGYDDAAQALSRIRQYREGLERVQGPNNAVPVFRVQNRKTHQIIIFS